MKRHTLICMAILAIASAALAANFPKELEGERHGWQSRSSMHLSEICTSHKCEQIPLTPGEPILLGAIYHFGTETIVLQFNEQCIWNGEICDLPIRGDYFDVWLTWDEDAGAYIQVLDIVEGEAEFISLTMISPEVGMLRIGVFDVVGNGKVFKYSKDYERQVFRLQRWFPPMVPDPGPA